MFGYSKDGFVFDLGYNGWIKSREKITLDTCTIDECVPARTFALDTFGLKGIQNVTLQTGELSDVTQSTATVFGNDFDQQAIITDSLSPVFISPQSINLRSASFPLAITHKIFTYFGHAWDQRDDQRIAPFFGVGGEIEFEGVNERNTKEPKKNSMAQWGVWFKAGFYS